jgi:PEP-CTERM motif-containing protein
LEFAAQVKASLLRIAARCPLASALEVQVVQYLVRVIAIALAVITVSASRAASSPITWQYDLTVHGTARTADPFPELFTVPVGTPMIVDVTFDTATPSQCGSDPLSAVYLIGIGNSNSSTVNFLGYNYGAFGGIEINSILGSCNPAPTFTNGGVRLFVGSNPVQVAQNAMQIEWFGQFGNLFLAIPPSALLGPAFPSGLPPEPFPFGGNNFIPGSSPDLQVDSFQLHPVPEPATALLVGSGIVAAAIRRRRSAQRQ